MFECVINISEGTRLDVLDVLRRAAGESFCDLHHDQHHNRSVFTLINDVVPLMSDVQNFITACFSHLTLEHHHGVHPRFGVVDVVPFVPLGNETTERAIELRNEMGQWISVHFGVPTFFYGGADATLPQVRKNAFRSLAPSTGPAEPSPSRGAVAVGARDVLLAWNIWLANTTLERAKEIAAQVRSANVRTLGLQVGDFVQVSCNLISPLTDGPGDVAKKVTALLEGSEALDHCELVGLSPRAVLENEARATWQYLGLSDETTIEARISLRINQPVRDAQ